MDNRDEELTVENVDEQVEQYLSRPQMFEPPASTSLARVIRNLPGAYEQERMDALWARINKSAPIVNSMYIEEQPTQDNIVHSRPPERLHFNTTSHKSNKRFPQSLHRKQWYSLGIGLVAAIVLITLFIWPILFYALRGSQIGGSQHPVKQTPQAQPTINVPDMKEYMSQYFQMQCPTNWVITREDKGNAGIDTQKAQFRPTAASPVFVNVDVMPASASSADQLLRGDPDAKLGNLISTNTATYNGRSWTIGIVELSGSPHTQAGKLEIAYSQQDSLYRIEFAAPQNLFDSYAQIFNSMFTSFHARNVVPSVGVTATPTFIPTATPTAISSPVSTPTPTPTTNVLSVKVYNGLYFTLQYPATWVITSVTTGGSYQQTVQFRPSATSPVYVNVNVMYSSSLTSKLLLLADPDVLLGTLLNTNTITSNGLSWAIGIVNLQSLLQSQPGEAEIAYANQNVPYKVEFAAPQDMFSSYTDVFNTILSSFSATS